MKENIQKILLFSLLASFSPSVLGLSLDTALGIEGALEKVKGAGNSPKRSCPPKAKAKAKAKSSTIIKEQNKWKRAGFANPQITFLQDDINKGVKPTRGIKFEYGLSIDAVILRGAGFNKKKIQKIYKTMAKIFAKCRVKITELKLITVDPPNKIIDYHFDFRRGPRGDSWVRNKLTACSLFEKYPRQVRSHRKRTIITHIRSIRSGAFGNSTKCSKSSPNSSWVAGRVKDPLHITASHESYHSLANDPSHHESSGNLMSSTAGKVRPILSERQCKKLRKRRGVLKKL